MGYQRRGRVVTGALQVLAAPSSAAAPPPAFTVSINFVPSPGGNISVSGGSGTLTPSQGVFSISESGGVTPYGGSPNGKTYVGRTDTRIFLAASSDGVHDTLGWSGLNIGDVISTAVQYTDTDSAGTTASSTSQTVTIQRIA